jgi:hypothetical protein
MMPRVLHQGLSSKQYPNHLRQGFAASVRWEGAHNHSDVNVLCLAHRAGEAFEALPDRNEGPGGK